MKKIISVLLTLVLLLGVFSGCSGKTDPGKSNEPAKPETAAPAASGEAPYEVRMIIALPATAPDQAALDRVIKAINEITLEKLNMTLKLEILPFSVYLEQVQLELSSGSDIDIFTSIASYCPTWVNSGYLVDLNTLLDEYGPDIVDTYANEQLAKVCSLNDFLYGVPVHKEVSFQPTMFFRTDILEKHNIDVSGIKTLADVDALYEQVAALEPGMWMLSCDNGGLAKSVVCDYVGGSSTRVGILDPVNSTKVVNVMESDEFREWCDYNHKWYQNGWINSGAASDTESYYTYISTGQAFSFFSDYGHPLSETDQEANCSGTDLTMVTLGEPYATTNTSAVFCYSISSGSKDPAKAMQMLNFIMTSKEAMNLLNWGVEGEDYVVNSEGLLDYVDGQDASSVGYHLDAGWILPNQFVCTPWNTSGADIYDRVIAYNESTTISKALGFVFDPADVTDIIAAMTNVHDKYYKALISGAVDPAEYIPMYVQELKDAGVDELVAEVQKQLDAWLASK